MVSYFRITLQRSAIGLPTRVRAVLKTLRLTKRTSSVFYPVSPTIAGKIMKVKELVSVEEVDRPLSKKQVREARRPDAGFWVERKRGDGEEERLEG
jgi:large subunit ribosomal protein L30